MLTRVLSLGVFFAGLLSPQSLNPPPVRDWAEAEKVEAELASHPDDLDTHVRLLRFYAGPGMQSADRARPRRVQQVLWFIEHHPENNYLQSCLIEPTADPDGFAQVSAAWQKALAAPKPLFDTYANAASFYCTADPARAHRIVEEGLKRYPGSGRLAQVKGTLIAQAIAGVKTVDQYGAPASFDENPKGREAEHGRKILESSDDVNLLSGAARGFQQIVFSRAFPAGRVPEIQELMVSLFTRADQLDPNFGRWKNELAMAFRNFAANAPARADKIALLEKGLSNALTPFSRSFLLPELAVQYFEGGDLDHAAKAANDALQSNPNAAGHEPFLANLMLGRIALKRDDRSEAARRLLEAANVYTTGPQFVNMPSDWRLTEELLAAGDRETVLAYLDKLHGRINDNRLTQWASTIRSGGTPTFTMGVDFPTAQYLGRPAPEFRLKDLKGADVSLADFKGKIVLLDFWATWCGPCRAEMPEFEKLHRELASKDVAILTVDPNENRETILPYMEKEKFTFPVLLGDGTDVIKRYSIPGYPTTFAIDKAGLVAEVVLGGSDLRSLIEKARAGAPAPSPVSTTLVTSRAAPPSTSPVTPEDFYREAIRQRSTRDYGAAVQSLDRALQLRADWLPAVALRANVLSAAKRYPEAIAAFTKAIELDPKNPTLYNERGLAYSNSGRHEQAIPDYTHAIEVQPRGSAGYNNRGWAYLETGRLDEALADLNQALEINPAYTAALFNRAHLFEKRRELARAVSDYEAILRIEPSNTAAANQKAAAQRSMAGDESSAASALTAPRLLSPAAGVVFDHYPRETTVVWAPVPGAAAYMVQWDFRDSSGWNSERRGDFSEVRVTEPIATFQFVGAQPGRWRVWAFDSAGNPGPKSEWREFRYTH